MPPLPEAGTSPLALSDLPSATVVVPTFRRPVQLRRCVDALTRLEYPRDRLEIVIVDDGGGTAATTLRTDLSSDLRLRVVEQANQGPASARNRGGREADGSILAFTDDDCAPRPDWLQRLAGALVAEPAALVGGRVVNALAGNNYAQASQDLVSFLYEYFPNGRALLPFFTSNSVACRREQFLEIGGFDQTFRHSAGEDRDFSERWAEAIGPLRYVPAAIVDHYHQLALKRFLRQHHYYGRGGTHLARIRLRRGHPRPRPEPVSFYARLLAYPVRHHGWRQGTVVSVLVGVAQVAGLTGMLMEAIRPSNLDAAGPQ